MGGEVAHEYLAPCPAGENEIALCEKGDYAANVEAARSVPSAPDFPEPLDAPREVATPEIHTIEEVAEFLSVDPRATAKAMPIVGPDGTLVLGLVHQMADDAAIPFHQRLAVGRRLDLGVGAGQVS